MFRSIRLYSLVSAWPASEQELSECLAAAGFKPCGPYVERSSGFEPPTAHAGLLARRVAGADLFRLRSQVRVLPAAALNEALEVRLDEYRARMQEEPGRRTKRQLKEQTRDELLPKTLLRSERTPAVCLVHERVLAIGTASETRADRVLEQLRHAFGTLEVKPFAFARPYAELLSRVFHGDGPRELIAARECRMREIKEEHGTVRWQNVDLAHSTVQKCARDGMEITHLAFELGNAMRAVLDVNGVLTKVELAGLEETAGGEEDEQAREDAELALLAGALRDLIATLTRALGADDADSARTRRPHEVVGTPGAPRVLGEVEPERVEAVGGA